MYNFIELVHQCYFTNSKTNLRSIGQVFDTYKIEKDQKKQWIDQFLADKDEFGHYVFDVSKRTFSKASETGDANETTESPQKVSPGDGPKAEELRKTARKLIPIFLPENEQRCLAIFDWLIARIPLTCFNSTDLCITLKNRETSETKNMSILDYLEALSGERGKPAADIISLHRFVMRGQAKMPRTFIKNQYLLNNP